MTALADAGSTLEGISAPVLGVVLVVALTALLAFDYWRRDYERRRREVMQRHPAGSQCGHESCAALIEKPMTDEELERGITALQWHLERRRGQS